jgi:acylphosphatase
MEKRRVHVVVSGRVQGVGFRHAARRRARELGLSGWVRNLPDGRVEAVAEGPGEQVEEFLRFLGRGPEGARVTALEVEDEEPRGEEGYFEVRI